MKPNYQTLKRVREPPSDRQLEAGISRIRRTVRERILEAGLTSKHLVVAVSGGPDSLSLLDTLVSLRKDLKLTLHGAHLNHCIRGTNSYRDAQAVRELFGGYGISCTVAEIDVPQLRKERKLSIEEAARLARYDFLGQVVQDVGADAVALGHTASDQAETVLLNVVRGTGLAGLSGMEVFSQRPIMGQAISLFRPLLNLWRNETLEYCEAMGFEPRWDETNDSTRLARGYLRQSLLPALKWFNPSVEKALVRLANNAARDLSYIEEQTELVWNDTVRVCSQFVEIDRNIFADLPESLQMQVLRKSVAAAKGDLANLDQSHLEGMMKLIRNRTGHSIDLPDGLTLSVDYTVAILAYDDKRMLGLPEINGRYSLNVPGETIMGRWRFHAAIRPSNEVEDYENKQVLFPDGLTAYFSPSLIDMPIHVRSRESGEVFQPLGMHGHKKIQDFMVDARIPQVLRDRIPLLATITSVAWITGWRIAEWSKVQSADKNCLKIRAELVESKGI